MTVNYLFRDYHAEPGAGLFLFSIKRNKHILKCFFILFLVEAILSAFIAYSVMRYIHRHL
jgi:hypothetical protein